MLRIKRKKLPTLSDEKLFEGVSNGNERMFEELYFRYNKRLLYYFYRMLGNDEQIAQDFLQELFYRILNKPKQFNNTKKLSTWIFSIAHNMCKNEYRSREVRKIIIKSDELESFCSYDNTEQSEELSVKYIYEEIDKLDDSYRTAFLLKYREGFDIKEISEILDLPMGTVKSRLFYTRKKIQANIIRNKRLSNY